MKKSQTDKNQSTLWGDPPEPSMLEFENRLWRNGYNYVCGLDEVGRGPLAGPVLAAAVILPQNLTIEGVKDSKSLTPAQRNELYQIIVKHALSIGLGAASPTVIDRIGILNATHLAFQRAINHLSISPDIILVDGYPIPSTLEQVNLIKGDTRSQTIAAASIIAKVTRDRLMETLHSHYPVYGFAQHKGYGTSFHRDILQQHGPCPIHRRSFHGVLKSPEQEQ